MGNIQKGETMKPIPSGQQMLKKRGVITSRVRELLKNKPPTRGNYASATFYYWRTYHDINITLKQFNDIFYLASPETIGRAIRHIQAAEKKKMKEGLNYDKRLLPTDRVLKKRRINKVAHKIYYSKEAKP